MASSSFFSFLQNHPVQDPEQLGAPLVNTSQVDQKLTSSSGSSPATPSTTPGSTTPGLSNSITSPSFVNPAYVATDKAISQNPNYQVRLTQNLVGGNLVVVGNAPQDFEMQLTNSYVDVLQVVELSAGGASSLFGSGVKDAFNAFTGISAFTGSTFNRAASIQVWIGTVPLDFTLPLSFRAYRDPLTEVMQPLVNIIQMASPKDAGVGVLGDKLSSPGPSPWDLLNAYKNGGLGVTSYQMLLSLDKAITMQIGRYTQVPGLIITGLSVKFGTRADRKSGLPIAAEATLNMKTVVSFSQQDVLSIFGNLNNNVGALGPLSVRNSAANRTTSGS